MQKKENEEKVFLVFNTSYFGDVLLCNSLCQNIRLNFPKSKIVFVVNKPFCDVARYQQDVDEVIIYDKKREHKGLIGMFKFIKNFPYKKPFCSLLTYKNERNLAISILLGTKNIIKPEKHNQISTQLAHTNLLLKLKNTQVENLPIRYNVPDEAIIKSKDLVENNEKYITLCCISKNIEKDMPIETTKELINRINNSYNKAVLVGVGEKCSDYAKELENSNCEFINLIDKTTIVELAGVLKNSKCLISVDTGTMHLGYAVGCPVVTPFYRSNTTDLWAPSEKLYKVRILTEDFSAENIFQNTMKLIEE